LTVEIAEESGLKVNREAFTALMLEQKTRAKADAKMKKSGVTDLSVYGEFRSLGLTTFSGYDTLVAEGKVLGIIKDGLAVKDAIQGEVVEVILDATSFYAESGGQAADAGTILGKGLELEVLDVQKPVKGLVSHKVLIRKGGLAINSSVETLVDSNWRLGAAQAHSGTHVVHAALRQVLGPTALQSGSYNKPGYLRLDFSWNAALSSEAKSEIEEISNLAIRQDLAVSAQLMSLPEAKSWGAVALFGETYDESVRVVEIGGPWSRELCGGTHVARSSQIGLVSITNESSVGSGSRRLEALVGYEALTALNRDRLLLMQLSESLKVNPANATERLSIVLQELKDSQRQLAALLTAALNSKIPEILSEGKDLAKTHLIAVSVADVPSVDVLRDLAVKIRDHVNVSSSTIALFAVIDSKPSCIVVANDMAQSAGIRAGDLVKVASGILGGGGGGKADIAQGGGVVISEIPNAIRAIVESLS
jgi:alanyl-tRNA synthetase